MKFKVFTAFLLVGIVYAAPTPENTITKTFLPDAFVKYTGQHDIVNILVPLHSFNSKKDDNLTIFFVEADINENGERSYQGLYVLKDGKAKKILDNGRDAASSAYNKTVYLAASDGLYTYKEDAQTAVKYGSINDSIIGITHVKEGNVSYILTEDNIVYEVKDNGKEKVKIDNVVNAQQIVLDYSDNLYFYTPDKMAHVRTSAGIKGIEGLPETPSKVSLIRPPFIMNIGVPFLVDNDIYIIYANGTSKKSNFNFKPTAIPTAFGMEAMLIQYFGYDKKIYEYNILTLIVDDFFGKLKKFWSGMD